MRYLRLLLCLFAAVAARASTFEWSGAAGDGQFNNPANWVQNAVPPSDNNTVLVFGNTGAGAIQLPVALLTFGQIQFQNTGGQSYTFNGLALVTIHNGLTASGGGSSRFASGVAVNLAGSSQTVTVSAGSLDLSGPLFGGATLVKQGAGNLTLSGLNIFAGGTKVESGSLTFSAATAVPVSGQIQASSSAYVGVTFNNSVQNAFLDRIDGDHYTGAVGFDTVSGQSTTVFAETINLTDLGSIAGIGTNTSARLTGGITIATGQNYKFVGTGTLYVESDLSSRNAKAIVSSAFGAPLTLVLRGTNSFIGGLDVTNAVVVLDGNKTIASASPSNPGRLLNLLGPGYIGATENLQLTPNGFLSRVGTIASPDAILGFDSANPAQTRVISNPVDLSLGGFRTDPYYLGTSSNVTLTGSITPTVGDALYLTAIKGGRLTVTSNLTPNVPALVVGQSNAFEPLGGTVELSGQSTFTGGTQVLGGTLRAAGNAALGTGTVSVADRATLSIAPGVTLPNTLNLSSGSILGGTGALAAPGGVTVGNGAHLSPAGRGGIGSLTFSTGLNLAGGAVFDFDMGAATGGAWDSFVVSGGGLSLTASASSPITINLFTVAPTGTSGSLFGFNNTQAYAWQFATANSINGFTPSAFAVNSTHFMNDLGGGSFFLSQNGGSLSLNFTPVPEPGTYVLLALGLGVVAIFELRRRRK